VRVLHNLDCDAGMAAAVSASLNADDDTRIDDAASLEASGEALVAAGALFYPVAVKAVVVPASGLLSATDRNDLKVRATEAIQGVVAEAGIGEAIIYNRIVERVMALTGVLDVSLDLWPNVGGALPPSRRNLIPPLTLRPTVLEGEGGVVTVDVGAQLVALDVRVSIELIGAGLEGDPTANREDARIQVAGQMRSAVGELAQVSVAHLSGLLTESEFYRVTALEFTKEYLDAGVRLHTVFTASDPAVPVSTLERLWVRTVRLLEVSA
jgi:hypothetical protein